MTDYIQAEISHHGNADWRVYLPEWGYTVQATSRPKAEHEAFRVLEEAFGLRSFRIVWHDC